MIKNYLPQTSSQSSERLQATEQAMRDLQDQELVLRLRLNMTILRLRLQVALLYRSISDPPDLI